MKEKEMSAQEITLDILHQAISEVLADLPTVMSTVKAETYLNSQMMGLVCSLRADLLAKKTVKKLCPVEFEYPSTWWQMFKNQFAPKWFKNKYPVQLKTETKYALFEEYDSYPRAKVALPEREYGYPVIKQYWTSPPPLIKQE